MIEFLPLYISTLNMDYSLPTFDGEHSSGTKEIEPKFIFNDPTTIMIIDGEKIVCTATDEPYDKEKGVLMCIAKYIGLTYSDIISMVDSGITQTKKSKKRKNDVTVSENSCTDSTATSSSSDEKYITAKSRTAKTIIRERSKEFGGDLSDLECMELAKISKNTFYKYKSEIKREIYESYRNA